MSKIAWFIGVFCFYSVSAFAYDCTTIKPFTPGGTHTVKVDVSKLKWSEGEPKYEHICTQSVTVNWFDVRGREKDAYYCLKPKPQEVITCPTLLDGASAKVYILPASWVRTWTYGPVRSYRFHAYVVKDDDPNYFFDVFSRSLSFELAPQKIIIEGSLKTGAHNPEDGMWVRAEFK